MPVRAAVSLRTLMTDSALRVSVSILFALTAFIDSSWIWLAAQAPLLLAVGAPSTGRLLILTSWVGSNLTLVGALGSISYLGIVSISASALVMAVTFANVLAIALFVSSKHVAPPRGSTGVAVSTPMNQLLLSAAITLLAFRFVHGVPLLLGNQARLDGVAQVSSLLGLSSGGIAIVASFVRSEPRVLTFLLKCLLLLCVLGTASRLLFLFVGIGLLTSASSQAFGRGLSIGLRGFGAILCGVAVAVIYQYRTPEDGLLAEKARATQLPPVAEQFANYFGTGIFLSARNGAAVFDVVKDTGIRPVGGFIAGGVINGLSLGIFGVDPERSLTLQLGFTSSQVGATATPIWAGAATDFGVFGAIIFAIAVGGFLGLICRQAPSLRVWLGLVVLLSFYGSYLVSAQFVFTAVLFAILVFWGRYAEGRSSKSRAFQVRRPECPALVSPDPIDELPFVKARGDS